jgi:hypothetical protein
MAVPSLPAIIQREQGPRDRHELEDLVDRPARLHLAPREPDGEVVLAAPETVGDVGRHRQLDVGVGVVPTLLDAVVVLHPDGERAVGIGVVDLHDEVRRLEARAGVGMMLGLPEDATDVLVDLVRAVEKRHVAFLVVSGDRTQTPTRVRHPSGGHRQSKRGTGALP